MTPHNPKEVKEKKKITWNLTPIVGTLGKNKILNWHGFAIPVGPGKNASILQDIEHRRQKVMQNAIIIVGAPGEGKSYFALRLAEIMDDKFNPFTQIVFERSHLLWLIGPNTPLKMGQVILIDEAQFIAGARRWYEDVQKDVMEHIEAIRSKGYIILIVALHIDLLDKIVRHFVLSGMFSMNERGKATAYHLWVPTFENKQFRKKMGRMLLQIPSFEQCAFPNCLICKFLDGQQKCMTLRAIYERMKRDFLNKMAINAQQKSAERDRKQRIINYPDTINKVLAFKENLVFNKNKVEPESVRLILEEKYGLALSDIEIKRVVKRGIIQHPEVFKPKLPVQLPKKAMAKIEVPKEKRNPVKDVFDTLTNAVESNSSDFQDLKAHFSESMTPSQLQEWSKKNSLVKSLLENSAVKEQIIKQLQKKKVKGEPEIPKDQAEEWM